MKYTHILTLAALLWGIVPLQMTAATPEVMVYQGRLFDADRRPITTAVTMRFSFWKNADWVPAHTQEGNINTAAFMYGGWTEEQTLTPNAQGMVSVKLGSVTSLPTMNFDSHKFLQVEVKNSGEASTAYQILDPTGDSGADAVDRQTIGSSPYAKNADAVDGKSPGTASGNLLVIGSGGVVGAARMGGATNSDRFTIDANGSSDDVALQFGTSISQTLSYSPSLGRFTFSDDVRIEGNLTVTGLINGVDITSLSSGTGTHTVQRVLHPAFEGVSYAGDGSDNVGQLSVQHDDATKSSEYLWTSTRPTLQDYDILLPITIPSDFVRWGTGSLRVTYKTSDASALMNAVDIFLFDTTGASITLSGATNLVSTTRTAVSFTLSSGTWTAGESALLKMTVKAKDQSQVRIGAIELHDVRTTGGE